MSVEEIESEGVAVAVALAVVADQHLNYLFRWFEIGSPEGKPFFSIALQLSLLLLF